MKRPHWLSTLLAGEVDAERVVAAARRRVERYPHLLAWYLRAGPFSSNRRRLRALHDLHKGERCFVIGNGPSLREMDLSPLSGEVTFGLNRIYLLFERLGFIPSYYVAINELVIEQCADEIAALPMTKFLNWHSRRYLEPAAGVSDPIYLRPIYQRRFSRDPASCLWGGATVTFVALQLAYYLGFSRVVLIGVDHSFVDKGTPNRTITSSGDDANHFDKGYFGAGFRWQLPDLRTSEVGYRLAREAFERAGREVVDATVEGKLRVFPKVRFSDLFR